MTKTYNTLNAKYYHAEEGGGVEFKINLRIYLRDIPNSSSLYDVPDDKLPDGLVLGASLNIK